MRSRYLPISVTFTATVLPLVRRHAANQDLLQTAQLRLQASVDNAQLAFDDASARRNCRRSHDVNFAARAEGFSQAVSAEPHLLCICLVDLDGEGPPGAGARRHSRTMSTTVS